MFALVRAENRVELVVASGGEDRLWQVIHLRRLDTDPPCVSPHLYDLHLAIGKSRQQLRATYAGNRIKLFVASLGHFCLPLSSLERAS